MGRKPCCAKEGVNRGAWTPKEDRILTTYINIHGEGKWRSLPQNAGLNRCGKSCRLRWLNYLKPDIKRGNISVEEEDLIIRLHNLLGNRWSFIARRLPGRTDNEIKNYWNTTLSKRMPISKNKISNNRQKRSEEEENVMKPHGPIRSKALKCTKVVPLDNQTSINDELLFKCDSESPSSSSPPNDTSSDFFTDFDINDKLLSDLSDILEFDEEKEIRETYSGINGDFNGIINKSFDFDFSIPSNDALLNSTSTSDESILMDDLEAMAATLDQLNEDSEPGFNTVGSFLNLEGEWLNDI